MKQYICNQVANVQFGYNLDINTYLLKKAKIHDKPNTIYLQTGYKGTNWYKFRFGHQHLPIKKKAKYMINQTPYLQTERTT